MSNTARNIDINVLCVENEPSYEVSYFDVKQANDALEAARSDVKSSVKEVKAIYQGKVMIHANFDLSWKAYRKAAKQAKILTNRYFQQCDKGRY